MMKSLKPYYDTGNYIGFWKIAKKYGDPLADLALDFHASLYGEGSSKIAISKLELAVSGGNSRLSPSALASLKSTIGRGVMEFHYQELKIDINANIGTPGILSVQQIDQYHYQYFNSIGLPRNTYGGHLLSAFPASVRRTIYCSNCDPVAP